MPAIQLTPDQIRWQRFRRTGLLEPFADAPAAARALIGIQAQILPAAGLALWNRTPELNHSGFEELLYSDRSLVKLWGQRHTLHIYASDDWPLLYAARSVNTTWWQRQAMKEGEEGMAALAEREQLIEQVVELLRNQESVGRRELRESGLPFRDGWLSPWGGIFSDLVHLGHACHYKRSEGEARLVARERWLPDLAWNPPDVESANQTIVRRYLAAYGPATLQDFCYWNGVYLRQARPWFDALRAELAEVEVEGQTGYMLATDVEEAAQPVPAPEAWPVRLLYRFDLYLLAHRNKHWVVPPDYHKAVFRPAGHIEGIVVVRGKAAGTWRYDRKGSGLLITVNPFQRLPKYVLKQVERRAKQVAAFFHLPLTDLVINAPGTAGP